MRYYYDASELIDNEIPIQLRAHLYPIFDNAFNFYKEFISEHSYIFNSVFFGNTKGQLLSYVINRYFETDMVSASFPFRYIAEKVNKFGYKSANLLTDNVIINISRARQPNGLPNKCKYRIKQCYQNNFNSLMLVIDIDNQNNLFVKNAPYCCFLTYEIMNDELVSVDLIVPDDKMKYCLKKIDLKSELCVYEKPIEPIEEPVIQEKKIMKLKKEILEKLEHARNDHES